MFVYTKLWLLLKERGMKRTDLLKIISSATLAKLGKNEIVSSEVLAKICDFLECQPSDIMENITKSQAEEIGIQFNAKIAEFLETLEIVTGQSKAELLEEFKKEAPAFIEKLKSGEPDILGLSDFK